MKWLVVLFFLPFFSFGQIHSLDWFCLDENKGYNSSALWIDEIGNAYSIVNTNSDSIRIRRNNKNMTFNKKGQYQIIKEDLNGNISLVQFIANEFTGNPPRFYMGKNNIYLVWDINDNSVDSLSDTLHVLDTTIIFTDKPQQQYPVQILKVSKTLDKIHSYRLLLTESNFASYSFARAEENSDENLVLFFNRYNAINSPKDSIVIENKTLKYGLAEHGRDMVLLNERLQFINAAKFERYIPPLNGSRRVSWSTYSINLFITDLENSNGGKGEYLFGNVSNDLTIKKIDTITTNLNLRNVQNEQCEAFGKLYCVGKTRDREITLNDKTISNDFEGLTTVLFVIDSTGETSYLGQFEGSLNPIITHHNNILWLKIPSRKRLFNFMGQSFETSHWNSFERPNQVSWYIALNEHNKIVKRINGATTDLTPLISPPLFYKNTITDINYATNYFHSPNSNLTFSYNDSIWQLGIFKTRLTYSVSPQVRPKLSFRYINCNSIEINYNKTDADHFLIIHSSDTSFSLPNDNESYNYSNDYLIAPKLGNDRIIYQGADSSITVKNLLSNRKHYFLIVPGNGVSGATTYNVDSVDTIEVFIPAISKAQLSISPSKDTASCQSDTLFANATSNYPIRWMDGKTENRRFMPETGTYYFTIKDSQACVVSSDTVTITKYPMPEINRIVASQKLPFCIGDSVWFAANSFALGAHPDSAKHASKAMETGWYTVKLTNRFDCQSTDSIYVEFGQKPTFKFLQDSVLSFDNKLRLNYNTNADSLLWVYGVDSANGYSNYIVSDSQYLFVNAIDESGCNIWDSILTMYQEPISEAFPNAFSPNGDGVNDIWYFLHPDTAGNLIIYDRWGGIVHHGPNRWDGKKNGETLPLGAYRYTFIYEENGEEQVKRGLITLIR
ncbi:MAG: gliding motility-associated C-terminal domain-containing protein [Bacteroidia bacterium]